MVFYMYTKSNGTYWVNIKGTIQSYDIKTKKWSNPVRAPETMSYIGIRPTASHRLTTPANTQIKKSIQPLVLTPALRKERIEELSAMPRVTKVHESLRNMRSKGMDPYAGDTANYLRWNATAGKTKLTDYRAVFSAHQPIARISPNTIAKPIKPLVLTPELRKERIEELSAMPRVTKVHESLRNMRSKGIDPYAGDTANYLRWNATAGKTKLTDYRAVFSAHQPIARISPNTIAKPIKPLVLTPELRKERIEELSAMPRVTKVHESLRNMRSKGIDPYAGDRRAKPAILVRTDNEQFNAIFGDLPIDLKNSNASMPKDYDEAVNELFGDLPKDSTNKLSKPANKPMELASAALPKPAIATPKPLPADYAPPKAAQFDNTPTIEHKSSSPAVVSANQETLTPSAEGKRNTTKISATAEYVPAPNSLPLKDSALAASGTDSGSRWERSASKNDPAQLAIAAEPLDVATAPAENQIVQAQNPYNTAYVNTNTPPANNTKGLSDVDAPPSKPGDSAIKNASGRITTEPAVPEPSTLATKPPRRTSELAMPADNSKVPLTEQVQAAQRERDLKLAPVIPAEMKNDQGHATVVISDINNPERKWEATKGVDEQGKNNYSIHAIGVNATTQEVEELGLPLMFARQRVGPDGSLEHAGYMELTELSQDISKHVGKDIILRPENGLPETFSQSNLGPNPIFYEIKPGIWIVKVEEGEDSKEYIYNPQRGVFYPRAGYEFSYAPLPGVPKPFFTEGTIDQDRPLDGIANTNEPRNPWAKNYIPRPAITRSPSDSSNQSITKRSSKSTTNNSAAIASPKKDWSKGMYHGEQKEQKSVSPEQKVARNILSSYGKTLADSTGIISPSLPGAIKTSVKAYKQRSNIGKAVEKGIAEKKSGYWNWKNGLRNRWCNI